MKEESRAVPSFAGVRRTERAQRKPLIRSNPGRLFGFVVALLAIVLAEIGLCVALPEGMISPSLGFAASCFTMLAGLGAGGVAARRMGITLPVPATIVALVAISKVALGVGLWDTLYYDTETQLPRPGFAASPIFRERQADVECLLVIMNYWRHGGLRYIGESEAYIPINNRPPAHLAALVVRAFGLRYHAYFPFVAFLTGVGALAMMAALLASKASDRAIRVSAWLLLMWPFSLNVGSVMKDVTLSGFVMLCAALLYLGRRTWHGLLSGVTVSFIFITPFRPAYALACFAAGLSGVLRGRLRRLGLPVAAVAVLGAGAMADRALDVSQVVYRQAQRYDETSEVMSQESKVMRIPLIGKVIYAFGTPFPWSQVFDDRLKIPMIFFFGQQVVTLAMILVVWRDVLARKTLPRLDDAAVLAGGMVALGLAYPATAAGYVHVGVVAALPFVAECSAWQGFGSRLAIALACFLAGNALWLLVR
jgi:hypothetical protein